jgi:hypothetical protein
MLTQNRTETLSQALLNLERIRKVEDPINYGIFGLSRVFAFPSQLDGRSVIYLKRFKEFCDHFETIASFEQKGDYNALEKWLFQKTSAEITSRIDSLLATYSIFTDRAERLKYVEDFKLLKKTVEDVLAGKIDSYKVHIALEKLRTLRKIVVEKFEHEKKISEKIIGGRTPTI